MTHLPVPQTHSIAFYCPHCCEPVSPSLGAAFHFPGTPLRKWFKVNLVHLLVESCAASLYGCATLLFTFVSPLLPLSTQKEKQDEAVKVSSIHLRAQKPRQPIFYLKQTNNEMLHSWTLLNVSVVRLDKQLLECGLKQVVVEEKQWARWPTARQRATLGLNVGCIKKLRINTCI